MILSVAPRRMALVLMAGIGLVQPALAQPGAGWITQRPGSVVDAQTQARVIGNRSRAAVTAAGGSAGLGLGLVASGQAKGQAQANSIGLTGIEADNNQLLVLLNEVTGLVNAYGGQASVNSVQVNSAGGRRPLGGSRFTLHGNRGGQVEALGGAASLAAGAGSLQAVGRAAANSALVDDSEVRDAQLTLGHNQATQLQAMGGMALAQALVAERSQLDRLRLAQSRNTAQDILAGGGSAGLGWGALARAELRGTAAANSVVIADSRATGATVTQQANEARTLNAVGGFALANSLNLARYQGGSLSAYQALQRGNTAQDVQTRGGAASLAGGLLADVQVAATALANSISIQQGEVAGATQHVLQNNTAEGVQAVGGGAAGNSLWLADTHTQGSAVTLEGNTARGVSTASGSASIAGGVVGDFERNGRALANSAVLASQSVLEQSPLLLRGNHAEGVRGAGGLAAANSVVMMQGQVRGSGATLSGNRAQDVQAQGFAASAGGGLLMSASQNAMALANSLGVFGGVVEGGGVAIRDNTAASLSAQGGRLIANSASVEGAAGDSRLSARLAIADNTAERISTGASSMAGPGHAFSSESNARAAANALVLHDNAQVDGASALRLSGNRATEVSAVGGTALVNTLAAYRGARVAGSPVTLADNRAAQVSAGGGYGQVAAIGQARNGVLVANGLYLDGEGGMLLTDSPLTVRGNVAQSIEADGGRINANALALNGAGRLQGHGVRIGDNHAEGVRSEGSEGTVAGVAVIHRGVGHANANAVQVLGALTGGSSTIAGNRAGDVHASQGLAQANSFTQERDGAAEGSTLRITGNTAQGVQASDGKTAAAHSLHNAGRLSASTVAIEHNQGGASASDDDAQASSVRNRAGATMANARVTLGRNQGTVARRGRIHSVDNDGQLESSRITILGNQGHVEGGGSVNSVANGRGRLRGAQIAIVNNRGSARCGGIVNSVDNHGRIDSSRIAIVGNTGSADGGGTVNSVVNRGELMAGHVVIAGNAGHAARGGTVNSVDNPGRLSGSVAIVGNRGAAQGGGVVNSVVNHGHLAGAVVIAGNHGSAGPGGTANSVINRGVITGTVAIVGNHSAAVGRTVGSVRTETAGVLAGSAGVAGNTPWAANVGAKVVKPPTGVIRRSVTVGPAVTTLNM